LANDKELSDFLKSAEKRAFKRTAYAVRDEDAALDIVQDSMIRLAEKYADRPVAELLRPGRRRRGRRFRPA
jgi:RNA polymerase sigma-70 factor (ECF subfamily)